METTVLVKPRMETHLFLLYFPFMFYYLFVVLFSKPAPLCHAVGHHDAERPTDNVAERHGDEIFGKHLRNGDFGAPEHAEGENEHVGDRVVESERDKCHDGKPDGGCSCIVWNAAKWDL